MFGGVAKPSLFPDHGQTETNILVVGYFGVYIPKRREEYMASVPYAPTVPLPCTMR